MPSEFPIRPNLLHDFIQPDIRLLNGLVEDLKASEDDKGFVRLPARAPFGQGEKVRLLDGALAARIGLFEELSDRDRVAVLFDILGRKVRVFVDPGSLAAA